MKRLLFVDDDPLLTRTFRRLFAPAEFLVETATDGPGAIEAMEAAPAHLILSDFDLVGTTGAQLLEEVRRRWPDTERILVTAQNNFRAAVDAVNRGAVFRILRKPWDDAELRFSVHAALEVRRLRHEHDALARALAEQTAAEQAAYEELIGLNENLSSIVHRRTRDMLEALSAALDVRDNETQLHSRRVSSYAYRLAVELGLDEDACRVVEQGALLHDIGKIGVPDRVLLKPGPLDEEEWTQMRRHPGIGAELLRGADFLAGAREVVAQHQERWDGKGYPMGYVGRQICIGARIFAVVDTYDALTSDRPYRKACDYARARAEIERVAGTQLDPDVAAVWCRVPVEVWDEIRDAVAAWAERVAA